MVGRRGRASRNFIGRLLSDVHRVSRHDRVRLEKRRDADRAGDGRSNVDRGRGDVDVYRRRATNVQRPRFEVDQKAPDEGSVQRDRGLRASLARREISTRTRGENDEVGLVHV